MSDTKQKNCKSDYAYGTLEYFHARVVELEKEQNIASDEADYYRTELAKAHEILGRVIHQTSERWDSVRLTKYYPTDNLHGKRNIKNPKGSKSFHTNQGNFDGEVGGSSECNTLLASGEGQGDGGPKIIGLVDVHRKNDYHDNDFLETYWYTCRNCNKNNIPDIAKYCPNCGIKLNWVGE